MEKQNQNKKNEQDFNKDYSNIAGTNLYVVNENLLPKGVSYKSIIGTPINKPKGKAPNVNKFAHLIDPDTRKGEAKTWY